jgi:hypothetical protein
MPLFDKVKAQAGQVAQKAQEAGKAGQAKLDQAQAKRKADALLRDLGAAVYAERSGHASPGKRKRDRPAGRGDRQPRGRTRVCL